MQLPPEVLVNSLVGFRNFNNFAAQMTTREDVQIQAIQDYVTFSLTRFFRLMECFDFKMGFKAKPI